MGYIYCITNQINGKQYVGKTTYSVTKRFKEHCLDSKKERCEKRPLYDAMNKYGIENFIVEKLLECDNLELSSYEILYIDVLNTYHNGYNATKGGDGSILFDYNKIIETYNTGITIKETAQKIGCCIDTVRKVLNIYNIPRNKIYSGSCQLPKSIIQLDKNTEEELLTFTSIAEAAHWLVDNGYAKKYGGGVRQKIGDCAYGKLKSAYKFKWKFLKQ